jgi:MYXO-CTERM domain-containing protein
MAGPTAPVLEQAEAAMPTDPDQIAARDALVGLLRAHPYLTRLYARLSPEEMTIDPVFRAHGGDDVPRERQLVRTVEGVDLCRDGTPDPCRFSACGAGASCTPVAASGYFLSLPGCGCADGTSGRATLDPSGQAVAVCQRMTSFLTPAEIGADPCAGYECGGGACVPINAAPTCLCDVGMVAVGFVRGSERRVLCVDPDETIPASVFVPDPPPDAGVAPDAGAPVPSLALGGGGCACRAAPGTRSPSLPFVLSALAALWAIRRVTRRHRWRSGRPRATRH